MGSKQHGKRILVAEDSALFALLLKDILTASGYEVVGPARTLDEARRLAADGRVDLAVLDVKLAEKEVFPVADKLGEDGVPFAFLTGQDPGVIPSRYVGRPLLQKPASMKTLLSTLESLSR